MSKSYSISQNFLTSRILINRLLRLTNINKNDHIIEIGAGKGHITQALAQYAKSVKAYEIDPKIFLNLKQKLIENDNVAIVNEDFLKAGLPRTKSYKVFSNIPFSITTDIIRKLLISDNPPEEAWIVMEKGAAKRFCGKPSESLMSLQLKPFFDLRIEYYFKRTDFHPMPSVDTVLLHFSRKKLPDIGRRERQAYLNFISHSFKNGLYGRKALLTSRQISQALRRANLPQIEPSGTILYIQWLCLFRCINGPSRDR
jgi:23S rRNA (adenine-N6)-dimethyltransferase